MQAAASVQVNPIQQALIRTILDNPITFSTSLPPGNTFNLHISVQHREDVERPLVGFIESTKIVWGGDPTLEARSRYEILRDDDILV